MSEARHADIPLKALVPTSLNPRVLDTDSAGFVELVASIAAMGVKVPILVRPKGTGKRFEILAGERRYAAAKACGLETIPAIVHEGLTDEEAFEITYAENFCREPLNVLEQGRAAVMLAAQFGGDLDAVAARLGQTRRWVALRLNLHANLADTWRPAAEQEASGWSVGHLALIARLPRAQQDDAAERLGVCGDAGATVEPCRVSVAGLGRFLAQRYTRDLTAALWSMDEIVTLDTTSYPACGGCRHRTGATPDLFGEDEVVPGTDLCLNGDCWNDKEYAWNRSRRDAIGTDIVVDMIGMPYSPERKDLAEIHGCRVVGREALCGEDDPDACPAMASNGPDAGKVVYVKSYQRHAPGTTVPKTLEEKRDQLDRRRWAAVIDAIQAHMTSMDVAGMDPDKAVKWLLVFGTTYTHDMATDGNRDDLWSAMIQADGVIVAGQYITPWDALWRILRSRLTYACSPGNLPDAYMVEAKHVAELLGIDIDALWAQACESNPEPGAWAKREPAGPVADTESAAVE